MSEINFKYIFVPEMNISTTFSIDVKVRENLPKLRDKKVNVGEVVQKALMDEFKKHNIKVKLSTEY